MSKFPSTSLAVISIRTHQVMETVHFYRDIVGLSGLVHHGHQPAFELENGTFLVIIENSLKEGQPVQSLRFPVLAFAVEDLDQAIARLVAHNIEMPWGIESNPQTRWVEFYDPGGNLVEFAQFNNQEQM